ncbi:MAG: hypothetical protein GF408_05745 [Candidatus Omnitrophica bacterium]|nr:hypothetical protein [Candidatus Omnitrophota bacterium]
MGPIEIIRYIAKQIIESVEYMLLRVLLRRPSGRRGGEPQRILIVQLNSMGDVIMSSAAVEAVRDRFPEKEIYMAVLPSTKELLDDDPDIDGIFVCGNRFWRDISRFRDSVKEIKRMREKRFSLCVDLGGTFGSMALSLLSGSSSVTGPLRGFRYGLFRSDTSLFFNKAVKQREKHIIRRYNELVGSLGCIPRSEEEKIYFPGEKKAEARKFMEDAGLEREGFFIVHPGAKWPPKRWPEDNFAQLISSARSRAVLVGAGYDRDSLERIKAASGRSDAVVACGLPLPSVAGLIENSSFFVGNDSSLSHMCAALGGRGVVLFGPTDPGVSRPLSEDLRVLHDRISCWPCTLYYRKDRCERGDNLCLKGITPERVLESLREITGGVR